LIYNPRNPLFQESRYINIYAISFASKIFWVLRNMADELDIMYMHVLLHGIGKQTRTILVH